MELTEESQLEGEDEPFTAVSLGGPSSPTTPTRTSGSHLAQQPSPSSPTFADAIRRRSRGDRTSFLLSNAARQSENRQSVDGSTKLREDFERLRASHSRSTSTHDVAHVGTSPRSSVHRGTSRSRRLSATSRTSRRSHASELAGPDGSAIQEEDGELVDEPIGPADGDDEDVDWGFWGEVMNGASSASPLSPGPASHVG